MSLHDEGHTVAGWTGTAIGTVGSTALGLGICGWTPGFVLGAGLCVLAILVTWGLHLGGWGKPPGPRPREQWRLTARDRSARGGHTDCLGCALAGRRRAPATLPTASLEGPATTAATTPATAPTTVPAGDPAP